MGRTGLTVGVQKGDQITRGAEALAAVRPGLRLTLKNDPRDSTVLYRERGLWASPRSGHRPTPHYVTLEKGPLHLSFLLR